MLWINIDSDVDINFIINLNIINLYSDLFKLNDNNICIK